MKRTRLVFCHFNHSQARILPLLPTPLINVRNNAQQPRFNGRSSAREKQHPKVSNPLRAPLILAGLEEHPAPSIVELRTLESKMRKGTCPENHTKKIGISSTASSGAR